MISYDKVRFRDGVDYGGSNKDFITSASATITREGDWFSFDTEGKTRAGTPAEKFEVHVSNVRYAVRSATVPMPDPAKPTPTAKPDTVKTRNQPTKTAT